MQPTDSNNEKTSILKNTRETKGLTLEIVHEATKIPMDALRAIEEGYSVRILSPFYYRGFIKIYSEFLGLDVGEMYRQYGLDQAPAKPTSSATLPQKTSRVPAGPNPAVEQMQEWVAFVSKPKTVKMVLKTAGILFLFFMLFKAGGCIASHLNKKGVVSKKQSVSLSSEKKARVHNDDGEEKSVPLVVPQEVRQEALPAQSEDHKVEVAVRADKNTWIQVKADDKLVFEMTLSKGSLENWSADKRIQISGRNLEQLDMEINGKHIGSLGGGERRIRKVIITPEGLTVKR
jgi:cytoskeletal protein RodZ